MEAVFSYLGQLVAFGGGAAVLGYGLFRHLASTWIENKFARHLEQLRHVQALELSRLKVEIDSLLSGAIKLQDKEFQTLPEAWVKLDEAFVQVSQLTSPSQVYFELDPLNDVQLEEFLATTSLEESQKDEIRNAPQKTAKYLELTFWRCLSDVREAIADLHSYVERNSIFMPPDLKNHFEKAANYLWSAVRSKESGHNAGNWEMQNEGWEKVKKEVEPLRKTIEESIYARLQAHGKSQSNSN